jgi:hypothetical protein
LVIVDADGWPPPLSVEQHGAWTGDVHRFFAQVHATRAIRLI